MSIVVYADESGTHDLTARQPGSHVLALGGYAGFEDDWVIFRDKWQAVLDRNQVDHFHFCEFANKHKCASDENSPYFGWDSARRHDFLFDLAKIAGDRKRIPFAACFKLAHFHGDELIKSHLRELGLTDQQINGPYLVYMGVFCEFFECFLAELNAREPNFKGSISFIFDRKNQDKYWQLAARGMFTHFAQKDPRFKDFIFLDKRTDVPLQAADMFVYRAHQVWENMHKDNKDQVFAELDYTLWGNFSGYEDFRAHYAKLFGRELPQLKTLTPDGSAQLF